MSIIRKSVIAAATIALAGGATAVASTPANAIGHEVDVYPTKQKCMDAGLDKFGHTNLVGSWGCAINPGKEGGWMLWEDDGWGD